MKKLWLVTGIMVLSAALFTAGALGPLAPEATRGTTVPKTTSASLASSPLIRPDDIDATIAALETRLEENNRDARTHAQLGLAFLQKAKTASDPSFYVDAERSFHASLEIQPEENFEALLGMAILQAARHDFRTALKWGVKARRVNRFNADALGVMTDALVELGRYHRAGRALEKMLSLRPDVASYARASFFAQLHGDNRGALRAMKLALDAAGGSPAETAWVSHHLADLYFTEGDLRKAAVYHSAAGRFGGIGTSYSRIGRAEVAIARGDTDTAVRLLEAVVDERPAIEPVTLLGDLYARRGDPEAAREQYRTMHSLYAKERSAGANVDGETAAFYADHGSPRKALSDARAEYRRRKSIEVADTYAWALYRSGRFHEAGRLSREARRLGTKDPTLYFHAGMIEFRAGRHAAARRHLRRSLALDPYNSFDARSATRVLRRLRR